MIRGLALLLLCQLVGEVISRGLGLPVPGPVLGLLLLFMALLVAGRRHPLGTDVAGETGQVADRLLQSLALLFVPAGVGVIKHLDLLAAHGTAILTTLIASTALTLVVAVLVFVAVARWSGDGDEAA